MYAAKDGSVSAAKLTRESSLHHSTSQNHMTLWQTSSDLRLMADSLSAAAVAKKPGLEAEAGREAAKLGLGLGYCGNWDTSG
jgi:hypothetical protein